MGALTLSQKRCGWIPRGENHQHLRGEEESKFQGLIGVPFMGRTTGAGVSGVDLGVAPAGAGARAGDGSSSAQGGARS